jgi:eukaryotic-like serine/threonine-protein kinase
MDANRYAKIRDLFFEAEEVPRSEVLEFLRQKAGDDQSLIDEVLSLLSEHDPSLAKQEGDQIAISPQQALVKSSVDSSVKPGPSSDAGSGSKRLSRIGPSDQTLDGVMRTHAVPRYSDVSSAAIAPAPRVDLWSAKTRRKFRNTGLWLYLASLLPTALIGFWTYTQIRSQLNQSVNNELYGVLDSIAFTTERFFNDRAELAESWSREPSVREAVLELVRQSKSDATPEELRDNPAIDRIGQQLRQLSGTDDVKFVVWNDSYTTIASWQPDHADVGNPIHPSGASNLARVMSGETVVYGPDRMTEDTVGYAPETKEPVIAMIVPIEDDRGRIVAAMMIRRTDWFTQFDSLFAEASQATGIDAYAVSQDAAMLTYSRHAQSLALTGRLDSYAENIAVNFRVTDPGTTRLSMSYPVNRSIRPITQAMADLTSGVPGVRIEPYPNYAGEKVVGASHWMNRWRMGVIVEQQASAAFAPVHLVRNSYLVLASLLALSSIIAAARIARASTAETAAIHPLSRYEILGMLGSGGMGTVYHARHRSLRRDTALKILRGDRQQREDRMRFDREAQLAASLVNPHSVTIYDYGRSPDGDAYCVMEYLRGLTIHEVVTRDGPQPIGRVLSVLRQVCDALIEAHAKGLCHRDIKPHNIMLAPDAAAGDWAVVFDYGLAKPLRPDKGVFQTAETIWAGTPMYMAPERFRQPGEMDPRSDIYSTGAVAYYMLAGRPPFLESDPESLFSLILSEEPLRISLQRDSELPPEIDQLVHRMMAKDVADRFESMVQLANELDRLRVDYPWTFEESNQWWKIHGDDETDTTVNPQELDADESVTK